LLRFFSIFSAAGAVALMLGAPASAGSTIAVATIAAGRLYVLGTTERPHTPVILDDQFRTESDDWGGFQYELVYHPAPCIVSATIQGKAYKAVVSDCSQQGSPGPSQGSGAVAAARPEPALGQPTEVRAPTEEAPPPRATLSTNATPPVGEVDTNQLPSRSSAINENASRVKDQIRGANLISNPPLPPQRPIFQAEAQLRSSRAAETTKNAKPVRRIDPRNVEGWLSD
jgi:hypothetical protein